MNKEVRKYTEYKEYRKHLLKGMLIVAIAGTISHFVYDWTGQNKLVGLFFPVDESTWEHMKLAFFPMLIFTVFMYDKSKGKIGYNFALLSGTIAATWCIPFLYYTYKGVLGFSKMWLDVSTYYVSLILSTLLMLHIAKRTGTLKYRTIFNICVAFIICQAIAFLIFTYYPLNLGICK